MTETEDCMNGNHLDIRYQDIVPNRPDENPVSRDVMYQLLYVDKDPVFIKAYNDALDRFWEKQSLKLK